MHYTSLKGVLGFAIIFAATGCGGGGGGSTSPSPAPAPPAASVTFSFPVVSTTTTPQGCEREDGRAGIAAVSFHIQGANGTDQVLQPCDSVSGRRVVTSQPGLSPNAVYIDAAGTVVAEMRNAAIEPTTLVAMLPGSNQQIELAGQSGSFPLKQFVGVFGDRVLYIGTNAGQSALVSVTIAAVPTRTVLKEVSGSVTVYERLVGGRVFFVDFPTSPPAINYYSVRPDGTDLLSLRSTTQPNPSFPFVIVRTVLRDREVIYSEQANQSTVPTLRMLAVDTPGSDVLIADAGLEQALPVPGAPDRFVFIGAYPPRTGGVLTDVIAERGNIRINTLALTPALGPLLGFSQGRLYVKEFLPGSSITENIFWLGEGGAAPRLVLSSIDRSYHVTDRALVYTRALAGGSVNYARSDLDGSNERIGSLAPRFFDETPTKAGEKIFYLREANTTNNHIVSMDLTNGVETEVYRPTPPAPIKFFRVGGRLIVWRPADPFLFEPGYLDSTDLNGNDRRRIYDGMDGFASEPRAF